MNTTLTQSAALAALLALPACGGPGHTQNDLTDSDATRVVDASMRFEAIPLERASMLLAPSQLQANGSPIDLGKLVGYASPTVYDYDDDGRLDLVVGAFVGKIQVFPNTGSATIPEFGAGSFLQADGEDIEISNW